MFKRPIFAVAAGLAIIVGLTTVVGAVTSPPTAYYACLKGGVLSSVATTAPTCAFGYTAISWNNSGPKGTTGAKGATGTTGSPGLTGLTGLPGLPGNNGSNGATGTPGVPGAPGLVWQGTWLSGHSYGIGTAVAHNGSSFVSLKTANLGNTPTTTATTHWQLLARKGTTGSSGGSGGSGGGVMESSGLATVTTVIGVAGNVGLLPLDGSLNPAPAGSLIGATLPFTSSRSFPIQVVPTNETISSITASFTSSVAVALIGTVITLHAQIFKSVNPTSMTMVAIPGTTVSLSPGLTGVLAIGTEASGSLPSLSIPVSARTKLLVVVSMSATGISLINTITGDFTVGISTGSSGPI